MHLIMSIFFGTLVRQKFLQNLLRIVTSLISCTFGLLLLFFLSPDTVNQQILADEKLWPMRNETFHRH